MRADTLLSKPLPITYDTATAVAGRITGSASVSNDDVYAGAVPTTTTCSPRSQDAAPRHWPVPLPVIATPGRPPPSARERRLLSTAAAPLRPPGIPVRPPQPERTGRAKTLRPPITGHRLASRRPRA